MGDLPLRVRPSDGGVVSAQPSTKLSVDCARSTPYVGTSRIGVQDGAAIPCMEQIYMSVAFRLRAGTTPS